jgi:hypothetical protein
MQRGQHFPGLVPADAVDDRVVGVPLEPNQRKLPLKPQVEGVVGSPGGISPPGSHGTEREPLDSLRSSHPVHRYARIHAQ